MRQIGGGGQNLKQLVFENLIQKAEKEREIQNLVSIYMVMQEFSFMKNSSRKNTSIPSYFS